MICPILGLVIEEGKPSPVACRKGDCPMFLGLEVDHLVAESCGLHWIAKLAKLAVLEYEEAPQ